MLSGRAPNIVGCISIGVLTSPLCLAMPGGVWWCACCLVCVCVFVCVCVLCLLLACVCFLNYVRIYSFCTRESSRLLHPKQSSKGGRSSRQFLDRCGWWESCGWFFFFVAGARIGRCGHLIFNVDQSRGGVRAKSRFSKIIGRKKRCRCAAGPVNCLAFAYLIPLCAPPIRFQNRIEFAKQLCLAT